MKNKILSVNPETLFLIIGLIYGLGFLIINPPLLGVDNEGEHFDKALYLSDGYVIPKILNHHAGYYVPEGAYNLEVEFYTFNDMHEKIKINDIFLLLYQPLKEHNKVFTDNSPISTAPFTSISFVAIITYSPVPYLASTFAMIIGKLLNASPIVLMYMGRLANLLVWISFVYMAIRITPVHKWVLFLLTLMPTTILLGASLSADSFTIAISFLVIAVFLNYAFNNNKKEVFLKDLGILFILTLLLALSKQTYFFLIFLFFLIPANKFGNLKKMIIVFSVLFLLGLEISIIWNAAVIHYYIPAYPGISIQGQLSFILSNPINFIVILINTILTNFILTSNTTTSFVSEFGDFGNNIYSLSIVLLYIFMLIFTSLLDKTNVIINNTKKLIIFITYIIIFTLICISMYLTATPVGQKVIWGMDVGRYLIPIAPLFFLLFYNNKIKFNIKNGFNLIIIFSVIVSLTIAMYLLIKNFYIL
jgi:uncharacterized membrane protein